MSDYLYIEKTEVDRLKAELVSSVSARAAMEIERNRLSEEVKNLKVKVAATQGTNKGLEATVESLRAENARIKAELAALRGATQAGRSMLSRLWEAVKKYDRIGFEGSDLLEVMSDAREMIDKGPSGPTEADERYIVENKKLHENWMAEKSKALSWEQIGKEHADAEKRALARIRDMEREFAGRVIRREVYPNFILQTYGDGHQVEVPHELDRSVYVSEDSVIHGPHPEAARRRDHRSPAEYQLVLAHQAVDEWDGQDDADLINLLSEKFGRNVRSEEPPKLTTHGPDLPEPFAIRPDL